MILYRSHSHIPVLYPSEFTELFLVTQLHHLPPSPNPHLPHALQSITILADPHPTSFTTLHQIPTHEADRHAPQHSLLSPPCHCSFVPCDSCPHVTIHRTESLTLALSLSLTLNIAQHIPGIVAACHNAHIPHDSSSHQHTGIPTSLTYIWT